MAADVSIDIYARDRGASSSLRQVGASADHAGEKWRKLGSMAKAGGLAVAAGAGLAAAGALKLVQGAMEDQKAATALAVSLKNSTGATKTQVAATEQWITAQGKAFGVADDELRPALGRLAVATGSVGKAQKLTRLAMNVSAGTGKNLTTVTAALAKAQLGSVSGLSKLGVRTKDVAGKTMSLHDITKQMAKTYDGQASKAAETAAGKFQRLKVQLSETGESIGYKLLPMVNDLGDAILNKAIPRAENLWRTFKNNGIDGLVHKIEHLTGTQGKLKPIVDEVEQSGKALWRIVKDLAPAFLDAANALPGFLSPLKMTGDVLDGIANALEIVPGGVKTLAIEAGIAAFAFSRLSGAALLAGGSIRTAGTYVGVASLEMRTAAGRALLMRDAMTKFSGAAKMAAGAGGLMALSSGMHEANNASRILQTTLGGALLGASIGGPIGALIGGGAGAALGFFTSKSAAAGDAAKHAIPPVTNFADSLDKVTGAATESTRSLVYLELQQKGAFEVANQLGVSHRDLVASMLGNEGATKRVAAATKYYNDQLQVSQVGFSGVTTVTHSATLAQERHNVAASKLRGILGNTTEALHKDSAAVRDQAKATQNLSHLTRTIPKRTVTKIEVAGGITPTLRGIARIANQYHLTPKQIRTVIKAVGVETSVKDVKRVADNLIHLDKQKVNLDGLRASLRSRMNDARMVADRGSKDVSQSLVRAPNKAKADLSTFAGSITRGVVGAKSAATSGGLGVGNNLQTSVIAGFSGTQARLSAAAYAAISAAIRSARAAAQIKSPSKKMHYIGEMMGKGAEDGLRKAGRGLSHAGADLIRDLVKGIGHEKVGADRVLAAIAKQVDKTKAKLQSMKELRSSTVGDFLGFQSSVFNAQAPTSEDGTAQPFTIDSLLASQAAERDKANQVKAAVQRLTRMGLSGSLLKQLQSSGSGGIDQLLALSQGNAAQIKLMNSLNSQTAGAYTATGLNVFSATGGAADLHEAERDARLAASISKAVHDAMTQREAHYEFVLRGDHLVALIKRRERDKGPTKPTPAKK